MSDKAERSPGGSDILRHKEQEKGFEPAFGDSEKEAAIVAHMERYYGKVESVFHEIISNRVHIDVHVIPPTPERNVYTLFTTGMSDKPMTVPPQAQGMEYAELMITLPPHWKVGEVGTVTPPREEDAEWYWPIGVMKMLARLPHDYSTWLGFGHTIPNGDPPAPFAPGTKLCCMLVVPSIQVPDEGRSVEYEGKTIHLYALHALHMEELSLKMNKGTDALLDHFDEHKVSEVLDPKRPPVVRKKLFGLF